MRLRILFALAAVLACSGDPVAPPPPTGTVGSLDGVTRNAITGEPLEGAEIVVAGLAAFSGSDGRFRIDSVPPGRQPLSAAQGGYVSLVDSVAIDAGVTTTVELALVEGAAPPPTPTGVIARAEGPGSVRVSWQAVAGADAYTVYWGTSPGVTPSNADHIANASNPFLHSGLSGGTTYFYIVTATGPDGESGPSAEVSAIPQGDIEVRLFMPRGWSGLADSAFHVGVIVTSVSQIASVTAQVGSSSAPLTFDLNLGHWVGTVSLGGLPSPSDQTLVVTANDVLGASAQISIPIRYDRPPAVTLTLPTPGAVATPSTHVVATCTDDGASGCTDFSIVAYDGHIDRFVLLTGSNHVDQVLSLAAFDGQSVELRAEGTDASQQLAQVSTKVYVDGSPHLIPVTNAGRGILLDADATRLLALDSLGTTDTLRVVNRASQASSVAFTQADPLFFQSAALTPAGAIFMATTALATQPLLVEWRGATLDILSEDQNLEGLTVRNGFALWNTGDSHTPILIRRDLAARTNVTVSNNAGDNTNDVAPNGDVVYWSNDFDIFSWHAGTTTPLTSDGTATFDFYPVTDGVHVVYTKRTGVIGPESIVLSDPGGDIVLATFASGLSGRTHYLVNGGWIAFTRPYQTGTAQIWTRSPAGVETQVSALGQNSWLDLLSPSGEVVFSSPLINSDRRYRAAAGSPPTDIGSGLGRALYIGGQLHVLLGATLFRVD